MMRRVVPRRDSTFVTIDELKELVRKQEAIVTCIYESPDGRKLISILLCECHPHDNDFNKRSFWFGDFQGNKHSRTSGWNDFLKKVDLDCLRVFDTTEEFLKFVEEGSYKIKA